METGFINIFKIEGIEDGSRIEQLGFVPQFLLYLYQCSEAGICIERSGMVGGVDDDE